jgi:hypothetical protein
MNRRSIVIASALLLTAGLSTASAQVGMVPRTRVGILAGVNFANFSGSDANDAKSRTGAIGGLSFDFHVAPHVGVEIDGLYSQQGAVEPGKGGDLTLKLDYVQVPVLLRYRFPTHTSVHPFLAVGPQVGFRVTCKVSSGGDSADCSDFTGENAKSTDFSGTAAAGLGFGFGKNELSIQARYNMGFSKVFSDSDVKNKVFSVLAGLSF